jgi:hypothetical protein
MKKPYEKPAIVHTERMESRAVVCVKSTDVCLPGPIAS